MLKKKLAAWIEEVESLSKISFSQLHAVYAHSLQSKLIYLC